MPAIAALGFKLTPGRNFAGALKPEAGLSPVQHQIAVEEFERGRFLCVRLIVADCDGGDDHVATVVEGDRKTSLLIGFMEKRFPFALAQRLPILWRHPRA
jgi:hypothetical protein